MDLEQTWKILGLVTDWLKHAEAKAAGTLAAAGVVGGVLYSLVGKQANPGFILSAFAIACFIFTAAAGLLAAWSLKPRLRANEDPASPLYFHHIARAHPRAGGGGNYRQTLNQMKTNDLVNEVADQIWANAHVATDKYKWANLALAALLLAVITLGGVATTIGWINR